MPLKLLLDYLTGNMALVNVPATTAAVPQTGSAVGLLLTLATLE